jgi:hypothetical protein
MELLPCSILEEIVLFLSVNEIYIALGTTCKSLHSLITSNVVSKRVLYLVTGVYML